MTEDIKWIEAIVKNKLVNRGLSNMQPQIVGFFRPEYLSEDERYNLHQ